MGHGVHLSSPGATSTTNTDTSYDSASHSSPRSKTPITNGPEIPESSIIKDTTPEDSSRSKAPANENRPVFKASTPKGPPHPKAPVTTNHSHSGAPAIHDYPYLRGTINKGSKVTKAPAAKISTTNSKTNGLKAIEETIIEPKKLKAVKETPLKQMPKVTKKRDLAELDENDTDNEKTPVKKPKKKPAAVEKPAAAKKPRATPTPPPPSTRPTRTRKAPVRFADEQQQQKEDLKKKPSTPKATSSKVFDPEYITTNPKSRLVNTDIYHMLLEPAAWDSLSAQDQAILIGMLPSSVTNQNLLQQITNGAAGVARPKEFTMCDTFSTDCRRYKEALENSQYTKGWLAASYEAMEARDEGKFDDWKEQESELWWGQKMMI